MNNRTSTPSGTDCQSVTKLQTKTKGFNTGLSAGKKLFFRYPVAVPLLISTKLCMQEEDVSTILPQTFINGSDP